ncbi:MAG: hypothetical protein CMD92_09580 [Gammaproteobacteria bacterium]|nr:hypothetical protein [Gammaproteobacteria bacterium]|tara:strand:- start:141 stop:998 length:858 start_codon:yes stop_codon:yes gene_type:complete
MVDALLPFLGKLSLRTRPCVPTKMYQQPNDDTTLSPPVNFGPSLPGVDRTDTDDIYVQKTLENGKINYLHNDVLVKQWNPASMTMTFFREIEKGRYAALVQCTLDRIDNTWKPVLYEWAAWHDEPKKVDVIDVHTGDLIFTMIQPKNERWTWRYDRDEKKTFVHKRIIEGWGNGKIEKEVKCDPNDMENPLEKVWVTGSGEDEEMHTVYYHPGTKRKIKEVRETKASVMTDYYKFDEVHQKEFKYREKMFPINRDKDVYGWDRKRRVRDWHDAQPNKAPTYYPPS